MSTRGTQSDIHISFDDLSITVRPHQTRIRQPINGWKKPSAGDYFKKKDRSTTTTMTAYVTRRKEAKDGKGKSKAMQGV
jgi:hypothetical protein